MRSEKYNVVCIINDINKVLYYLYSFIKNITVFYIIYYNINIYYNITFIYSFIKNITV